MAREQGLAISKLEEDQELQDKVLSAHHACAHAFGMTPTYKIVENNLGRGFFQQATPTVQIPLQMPTMVPHQPPPAPPLSLKEKGLSISVQ